MSQLLLHDTEPTPEPFHGDHTQAKTKTPHMARETVIDVLYENERGGFLCGIALFSSQALGGLDPPAWSKFLTVWVHRFVDINLALCSQQVSQGLAEQYTQRTSS